MCPPPPAGDAPFSWPPSANDLARVEVLDVTQSLAGRAGMAPSPSRPAGPRARRHAARRHARARASTAPSARTRDGWLLLASGVLIGATLPGLGQIRPTAHEPHAAPTAAASTEGADLRAMQSLLRGDGGAARDDRRADARVAVAAANEPGERADPPPPASLPPTPRPTPERVPMPENATGVQTTSLSAETLRAASPPSRQPGTRRTTRPAAFRTDDRELPIRRVLQAYERAWSRMDAGATRAVWPSADPSMLQAAFGSVSEQRLQLAACDLGMSGDRALAVCLGTLRYRPRNSAKAPGVGRGRWEFDLQRSPDGWRITAVDRP